MGVNGWLKKVEDFGRAAKNSTQPLAFVFGAGCSISSGAPATSDVHRAFEEATVGRANKQPLREFLQHIKELERQQMLAPLFQRMTPYIGYRSLAALARMRRVHVLNLNWDPLIEEACRRAGVECISFDLRDRDRWKELQNLPAGRGLACVHVHGILGDSCRYSVLETLQFEEAEVEFIREEFWNRLLLITGASLQGDFDLEAFLTSGAKITRANGLWYFSRGWGDDQAALVTTQDRLHVLGAEPREFCVDPAVDFDRLMLTILEEAKGMRWDDLAAASHAAPLPVAEKLLTVESRLIREVLDAPALALIGEPRLGKTVLAHFLAHCIRLWAKDGFDFRRFDSPDTTVAALAGVNPASASPGVFVMEDPFGPTDRFEENPAFFAEVTRLFGSGAAPSALRLIVTSRRRGWHTALQKQPAASLCTTLLSERAGDWYRKDDLIRLADGNKVLAALVHQDILRTPGSIVAEERRQRLSGVPAPAVNDRDTLAETVALLDEFPEAGLLCSLVRLQDFCQHSFSEDELLQWVDATSNTSLTEAFLHRFEFEGLPRLKLDHPSTREAVDLYLTRHAGDVANHLSAKLYPRHQLVRAVDAWALLANGSSSAHLAAPATAALERWGGAYFAAEPTLSRLEEAIDRASDQWAMTELAYEVVRLWEALPSGKPRNDLLARFAADRARFGTYALFEGCLYLQAAASPEIQGMVEAQAWMLVSDSATVREATLMVDGWMWRPLPDREMPAWVGTFLQHLPTDAPAWALVRFLEGYHPEGFATLPQVFRERDRSVAWTREQAEFATWLVKWHFAHQAYARVLLSRLRLMDKGFLCRTLHPAQSDGSFDAMQRLIGSISAFPEFTGWAFHLGCNVGCVQARLNDDLTERLRVLLPDVASADEGLITAAATYNTAKLFQPELRRYFAADANRAAFLDVLRDGVAIDGSRIKPPRFSFSREPADLYGELDIRWKRLRSQSVGTHEPSKLAEEFWVIAQPAIASGKITAIEMDRFSAEIEVGDLRRIEEHATAARAGVSALQQIFDTYLATKAAMPLFTP